MKRILFALVIMILGVSAVSAHDTYSRDASVLPAAAQSFISKNFKAKVNLVKIDSKTFGGREYDVILTDGTEVSFDKSGNWEEIEVGNDRSVPDAVVPELTRRFIKANHKGTKIVSIERERHGYSIELSNGIDFKTDRNGEFKRYDD